jgi:hypothetical protein
MRPASMIAVVTPRATVARLIGRAPLLRIWQAAESR